MTKVEVVKDMFAFRVELAGLIRIDRDVINRG